MNFAILEAGALNADCLEQWRQLQRSNHKISSPFFCPEFTLAVASAYGNVRIAVIEDSGSIAGFFPFQVDRMGFGKPVGGRLSDYQGIVSSPGFSCNAIELLRACRLVAWDFDRLAPGQRTFADFHRRIQPAFYIDTTRGFPAYKQERNAAGSNIFKEVARKIRLVERELGRLRFTLLSTDDAIFRLILSWKSAQLRRMMVSDVFVRPRVLRTLNIIRAAGEPSFGGILSVLYAGDIPIAGHFGMRSDSVYNGFVIAYAPEYARFSPGSILVYKLAEHASSLGINKIDLGKGQAHYKERFANGQALAAEGSVEIGSLLKWGRKCGRTVRSALDNSGLAKPARRWLSHINELSVRS